MLAAQRTKTAAVAAHAGHSWATTWSGHSNFFARISPRQASLAFRLGLAEVLGPGQLVLAGEQGQIAQLFRGRHGIDLGRGLERDFAELGSRRKSNIQGLGLVLEEALQRRGNSRIGLCQASRAQSLDRGGRIQLCPSGPRPSGASLASARPVNALMMSALNAAALAFACSCPIPSAGPGRGWPRASPRPDCRPFGIAAK